MGKPYLALLKNLKQLKTTLFSLALFCNMGFISAVNAVETVFWVDNRMGVAISGYDPISFFLRGQGAVGSRNYEYFWAGAVWRFENEGNLNAFRDSPLTYAPQFGGYDAVKMALDLQVSPDPKYSEMFENRLYLFHSQVNLDEWHDSKSKYIKAGRTNWLELYAFSIFKNFAVQLIEPIVYVDENQQILDAAAKYVAERELEASGKLTSTDPIVGNSPSGGLDSSQRLNAAAKQFKDKQ